MNSKPILLITFFLFIKIIYGQTSNVDSSFVFPLNVGDKWFYNVDNSSFPGHHWNYSTTFIIKSDTVMPNNKKYFEFPAMLDELGTDTVSSIIYLRKSGLKVYEYITADSNEHLLFDFSANIGDTLSYFEYEPLTGQPTNHPQYIILNSIDTLEYFLKIKLKTFNFSGILVADTLGITYATNAIGTLWSLFGATIDGKSYGNILSVQLKENKEPSNFSIYQNYPNPFNPSTIITYSLPQKSRVTLKIYDLLGKEICTLVNGEKTSGTYKVVWNAQNVPSGVYFYKITAGAFSKTNKMLLLK